MYFSENISLKPYNTFGVKAKAHFFAEIDNVDELVSIIKNFKPVTSKYIVLGGGSNILFTQDFAGWVFQNQIKGIEIVEETKDTVLIKAGGGENWSDFVDFTVNKGWGGLENLSLIPGTVGAAPVQNIGAYGVEQQDAFVELEACNLYSGKISRFNKLECDFGYRFSIFKENEKDKWMVLHVTYRLQKKPTLRLDYAPLKQFFIDHPEIKLSVETVSDAVKQIRRSKLPDPQKLGNAGSFFKNPVISAERFRYLQKKHPEIPFYKQPDGYIKIPAGWLIEKAGWKGKHKGYVGIHSKQALVIVNYGNASGIEILRFAEMVQKEVYKHFDIRLEPEVTIV